MRRLVRARRRAFTALAVLAAALGSATPVVAATSCSVVGAVAEVTIPGGESATIVLAGDEIHVEGSQCGSATMSTIDTIELIGDIATFGDQTGVEIDLSGGSFAGIAFTGDLGAGTITVLATGDPEHIVAGANGVNLDADAGNSVDVDVDGVVRLLVNGSGGGDVLRADGGEGTGGPSLTRVTIDGGEGDDLIAGSRSNDELAGGDGIDTVDYSAATSSAFVDLKLGSSTGGGVGNDVLSGFENANGSPYSDTLTGNAGPNVLKAFGQNDTLKGLGGDDVLVGGPGEDTVDFSSSKARVVVNLARKTARGEGADTIRGVEIAIGGKGDDRITGTRGRNKLYGGRGDDTIVAKGGDDHLVGDVGNDTLKGGAGDDQLYGGDGNDRMDGGPGYDACSTWPGSDTRTGCEIP